MNRPHFFIRLVILMIVALSFTACHKEPKEKPEEPILVTDIGLNTDKLILAPGDTATIMATVQPEHATNKTVTWESSNPSVATVTDKGLVTAIANGKATITATTQEGGKPASCNVTVDNLVQWIGEWDFEAHSSWYYPIDNSGDTTIYYIGEITYGNEFGKLNIELGGSLAFLSVKVSETGVFSEPSGFYFDYFGYFKQGQFEGNNKIYISFVEYGASHWYNCTINGIKKERRQQ